MSFAAGSARFAVAAARSRRTLSPATIQPYSGVAPATPAGVAVGQPLSVFLSAVRIERELAEAGIVTAHKAVLRVLSTCPWQPTEGSEFVKTSTGERFRCNTAVASEFGAETVCEVVRISA